MTDPTHCHHSFPDPYPQPLTQIGNCRHCGTTYQKAKRQRQAQPGLCGAPHHQHPETLCTQPAGHYQPDRDPHAGPLILDGRIIGGAAWDEPRDTTA